MARDDRARMDAILAGAGGDEPRASDRARMDAILGIGPAPEPRRRTIGEMARRPEMRPAERPPIFSGGTLMDVLDVIAAPGYATMGAIHEFARPVGEAIGEGRGLAGLLEGLESIPGGAWRGMGRRASFHDILQETVPEWKEEHPWAAGGASLLADIATYPGGLARLGTRGAGLAARPAARAGVAAAERVPFLGPRLVAPARAGVTTFLEARAPIRAGQRVRELEESGVAMRRGEVTGRIQKESQRLVETQKKMPTAPLPKPEFRLIPAGQKLLPEERLGIAAELPLPGQKVTQSNVETLAAAWAEGHSPSGLAQTAEIARGEIETYAKLLGLDMPRFRRLGGYIKGQGELYGPELVRAGAITAEEAAEMQVSGGYVRRMYEDKLLRWPEQVEKLKAAGKTEEAAKLVSYMENRVPISTGGRAQASLRRLAERKGLPTEVRAGLGEVTEASPRVYEQFRVIESILPRMRMFQRFSRDPKLASLTYRPGWLQLPTKKAAQLIDDAMEAAAAGQAGRADELMAVARHGGWGELAGRWVHPVLHDALIPKTLDLSQAGIGGMASAVARWMKALAAPAIERERVPRTGFWAAEAGALRTLKPAWTLWNLAGSLRNDSANMIAMHTYVGVPLPLVPYFYFKGFQHALKRTPFFRQIAREMPSIGQSASKREYRLAVDILADVTKGGRVTQSLRKRITGLPAAKWELSEVAGKIGATEYLIWRGMPRAQAVRLGEEALYHYGDVARIIEKLRTYGPIPFPTYAWKTAAMFPKAAWQHPERVSVWTRAMQNIGAMTPAEQREGEYELLPEWEKEGLPVRLPGADVLGRGRWARGAYALPWGSLDPEMLEAPVGGRLLVPADPLLDIARNRSWTGAPVWREGVDTGKAKWGKIGWHLVKSYAPMGYVIAEAQKARREKARVAAGGPPLPPTERKPLTRGELALRSVGVSLYVQDLPVALQWRKRDLDQEKSLIRAWVRQRIQETGTLSPADKEELERRVTALGEKAQTFAAAIKKLQPRLRAVPMAPQGEEAGAAPEPGRLAEGLMAPAR